MFKRCLTFLPHRHGGLGYPLVAVDECRHGRLGEPVAGSVVDERQGVVDYGGYGVVGLRGREPNQRSSTNGRENAEPRRGVFIKGT